MKSYGLAFFLMAVPWLIGSGCGPRPEAAPDAVPPAEVTEGPTVDSTSASIRAARELLQAGQVDDAAARLAQMQVQGASFDAAQAREFRQAYSDAYDRSLEAIERGDPRGEAALRLLRVAAPR